MHIFPAGIRPGPWRPQMMYINEVIENNLIKETTIIYKLLAELRETNEGVKHSSKQQRRAIITPRPEEEKWGSNGQNTE